MEKINQLLNEYKIPIGLSLVGLVLIIGGIFSSGILNKPKQYPKESLVDQKPNTIKVDISGAVVKPGVYSIPLGSRVEDIIKASGGFDQRSNKEYISKSLNLSQKISDGQKIYVPFEGETVGGVAGAQSSKIGLNSATQSQLEALPGIGPATALKIIAGRPFADVNELISKKVVSRAVFEKIKDLVDIN